MFTINRPVGHRLLPHTDSRWVSPRGRRLLFRQLNAHPERLDPAATAYNFRASQCAVYRDLLDAVMKEACGVGNGRTIAWTAHDDEFSSRVGH
jgi:hypothetical protein